MDSSSINFFRYDSYVPTRLVSGLYLSGLNMMEGILNKEQLAKVPSKTKKPS